MKRMIRYCMSEDYYRPLYSFVAAAYILATFYFWVPIPLVVWDVRLPAIRSIIYGKLGEQTSDKSVFNPWHRRCTQFACLCGICLSVPCSYVSITENVGMILEYSLLCVIYISLP